MQTYRDHPLAFLCGRPSVAGMRLRADDWRKKNHKCPGADVARLFEEVADNIEQTQVSLHLLLEMVQSQCDLRSIARACAEIHVDLSAAEKAMETAQLMRVRMIDPYGGSVCASLEMGWEEIHRLHDCITSVASLSESRLSHNAIKEILVEALDLSPDRVVTHDAPKSFM